jgi:hypothetical protein
LSKPAGLKPEHADLDTADQHQSASKEHQPPIGRRFLVALASLLLTLSISSWGWKNFDHQRRLLGAAAIGSGLLLGCAGLGLWWATGFPSTWGWWL